MWSTIRQLSVRHALQLDAVVSGGFGLLLVVGADVAAPLLGLSPMLLRVAGAALLPFAAALVWLGARAAPSRGAVLGVVVVNALWVIDSVALVAGGFTDVTFLGSCVVLGQAAAVAAFAALQYHAARRIVPRRPVAGTA